MVESLWGLPVLVVTAAVIPRWMLREWSLAPRGRSALLLAAPVSPCVHTLSFRGKGMRLVSSSLCPGYLAPRATVLSVCPLWPCHSTYVVFLPWPGAEPMPAAVEAGSLNHGTARDIPLPLLSSFPFTENKTRWGYCCRSLPGNWGQHSYGSSGVTVRALSSDEISCVKCLPWCPGQIETLMLVERAVLIDWLLPEEHS